MVSKIFEYNYHSFFLAQGRMFYGFFRGLLGAVYWTEETSRTIEVMLLFFNNSPFAFWKQDQKFSGILFKHKGLVLECRIHTP